MIPPIREFRWPRMHRLIPSRFSASGTVLENVADDEEMLADAARLDAATNERVHAETHGLSGISQLELIYGIPDAHIVRAAFLHPGPFGARFNDTTRGSWYAAHSLETALAEVAYHKARRLAEIVVPESPAGRPDEDSSTYDDWLAGFHASFHVLEPAKKFAEFLKPEPVPHCYAASQRLARQLLEQQSNGVVYPSVRHSGGTCLACFRPALVTRPRRGPTCEIRLRLRGNEYKIAHRVVIA